MPPKAKSYSISATSCGSGIKRVPLARTPMCQASSSINGNAVATPKRRNPAALKSCVANYALFIKLLLMKVL